MRAVVQRVNHASVTVDGAVCGEISKGLLVLLGIFCGDGESECEFVANRVAGLRIFADEEEKLNLSAKDLGLSILVVPNFTVAGDCHKGNRPSFINAMAPPLAQPLFERFKAEIEGKGISVRSGIFGADMKVALENDGPVTVIVEKYAEK